MYGFLLYVITTAILVFGYPTPATPAPGLLPHSCGIVGALMVCVGGYWFWFFIRVDVAAEGNSPFRIVRADLFILSLLASATLALLWAMAADGGQLVGDDLPRSVPDRHDGALRIRVLVEVLAHVLQARGRLPEARGRSERHAEQSAGPRRQAGRLRHRRAACRAHY